MPVRLRVCFVLGLLVLPSGMLRGDEAVRFNRDIRPILSDACYTCHGPDENTRTTELRLDLEGPALADLGGYRAIVPGDLKASELWQRVTADDPDLRMPPADSGRLLTKDQLDLLRRWIEQGAKWEPHWSFVSPQRPDLPAVRTRDWPRNAIDHFILARLEEEGLEPSHEAPKETLLRRVTLDLTGLPPTLDEIDDFLADDSPDAYERVVDRLLASPRYGERMLLEWLDAARYSDTNGYQPDGTRAMWPWRDWVIDALNANVPFDRFTVEQIAGDLLVAGARGQRSEVRGQKSEVRSQEAGGRGQEAGGRDQQATTDHSPLSTHQGADAPRSPQTTDNGQRTLIATGFHRNHMLNGEGGRIAEESRVDYVVDRVDTTGTVWLGLTLGCARCHDHKYDPVSQKEFYGLYAYFNNIAETGGVDRRSSTAAPTLELPTTEQQAKIDELTRVVSECERQLKETTDRLLAAQKEWEQSADAAALPEKIAALLKLPADDRSPEQAKELSDYYLSQSEERQSLQKQLDEAKNALNGVRNAVLITMVMEERPQPRETFVLLRGEYDKYGEKVAPGIPSALPPLPEGAPNNRLGFARWLVDRGNPLTARVTVNRYWQLFFGAGLVRTPEDFGSQGELPSHPELLDWLAVEFMEGRGSRVESQEPEGRGQRSEVRDQESGVRGQESGGRGQESEVRGQESGGRGQETGGSDETTTHHSPLTSHDGPRTTDNPWNVKALHRLIVTSATYRQGSRVASELHERDLDNRLLARGPRLRLNSHFLRDQALAVSGLLVERLGGPPVRPYQPPGIWEDFSFGKIRYQQDTGEKLYRRSLYTFWRRSVGPTMLFDTPTRQVCTVRQPQTNTPLHALVLMNDITYVEASRVFAQRMLTEGGATPQERIEWAFRTATARRPTTEERDILMRACERTLDQYQADPEAAARLIAIGDSPPAPHLDPVELAAWTGIASVILNLDEVINKQ